MSGALFLKIKEYKSMEYNRKMILEDGSETWVARRYVQTIQKTLKAGVSGKEGV